MTQTIFVIYFDVQVLSDSLSFNDNVKEAFELKGTGGLLQKWLNDIKTSAEAKKPEDKVPIMNIHDISVVQNLFSARDDHDPMVWIIAFMMLIVIAIQIMFQIKERFRLMLLLF